MIRWFALLCKCKSQELEHIEMDVRTDLKSFINSTECDVEFDEII